MDYEKYLKDLYAFTFVGNDEVYIQGKDDSLTAVDLPVNSKKPLLEVSRFLRKVFPGKTESEIKEKQGTEWNAILLASEKKKALREFVDKYGKKGIAALTVYGVLKLTACAQQEEIQPAVIESTTIETEAPTIENELDVKTTNVKYDYGFDIENMTSEQVVELITKGTVNGQAVEINETQRQLFLKVYNFMKDNAQKEDWEKVTLSDEEFEAINERLAALGYQPLEDKEVRFNFNSFEDMLNFANRFDEYTKEEAAERNAGQQFDVTSIMEDGSNKVIRDLIVYYVNSNSYELNIGDVINFNDKELATLDEMNTLFREYKELLNEGKEKEAEAKMNELHGWIITFANNPDFEQSNLKAFISRVGFESAAVLSGLQGYEKTTSITVHDKVLDKDVEIKITLPLFDEVEGAQVVRGFKDFDAINYYHANGLATRYIPLVDTVSQSIADQSCGAQLARLEEANEYMNAIRSMDISSEVTFATSNEVDLSQYGVVDSLDNVKTEYDQYTDGTVLDIYELSTKVDEYFGTLGIAANGMEYFTTFTPQSKMYNDRVNAATNNLPAGNGLGTGTGTTGAITAAQAGQNFTADQIAQAQYNAVLAENGGKTPEQVIAERQAVLQAAADTAYNYFKYGIGDITALLNSGDQEIMSLVYEMQSVVEAEKSSGAMSGGETTYNNQGIGPMSDTTAPEADKPGAIQSEQITNPNQGEINNNMAEVEIASQANSGNAPSNNVPTVPGDQTTTTTQTITAEDVNNQPGAPQTNANANSTNNAPTEDEMFDSEEEALAALNSGYQK